jgi:Na+/H+ antiporter NhaA
MKSIKESINPLTPIQEFFKTESSSGIVLLCTTVLALILANSPFAYSYFAFF